MSKTDSSKNKKPNEKQNSKFEKIRKNNLETFKKRYEGLQFDDSDDEDFEIDKGKINELFKNYQGNDIDIARISQFFDSGDNIDCLICIRQVKTKDKIWSCTSCYCCFHLLCIQKWANDSMNQKRIYYDNQPSGYYSQAGVFIPKKEVVISWDCPQCRRNYDAVDIPRHYKCYCGREDDPLPQPFLIPHSCGEICNKSFGCGHRCVLLCHPGPCPSCAQVIHKSCKCQKSPIKAIRCSQQEFTCGKKCLKTLPCQVHKCDDVCHDICPPCRKTIMKKCSCGANEKEVICSQAAWSCQKTCNKKFACNIHSCKRKCHAENCGNCPYGLKRSCFCGKQSFFSDTCEEFTAESCGDTCLKPLPCGDSNHRCLMRCHKADCGTCVELVEKKCRCGNITKEFPCSKELLCEVKCKYMKSCKKHPCNRKCCVECPPCDKICSKQLSCTKHKCMALCHDGSCYPCTVKQQVKCRCGSTTISVLCGRWKKNRSPKCKESCKLPSKCHHDPLPHKCHFGDCPSCSQVCDEILACSHRCLSKCHDYSKVITKDKNFVPKLPGECAEEYIEMKKLPHPVCATKIKVCCIGGHEESMQECHDARSLSCGRACNRNLNCGNHFCSLPCHVIADPKSEEQDANCEDCNLPCSRPRPLGCTHQCPRGCHQNSCKRCHVMIKTKCFCGLTDALYRCCDVHKRDLSESEINELKLKYMCCGSRCIRNYSCGHQCTATCHSGKCPDAENCKAKIKLTCECKTRKANFTCDKVRAENMTSLTCDEQCQLKKKLADEERQLELQRQAEIEAEKNRRELEEFEKKFAKKKGKERKQRIVEEKQQNYYLPIIIAVISLLIAFGVYFTVL